MQLTREEENKNRIISGVTTAVIFGLLLLFFILFNLVTQNPPFPEDGGGGGQELALGMMNAGNDNLDYSSMGNLTNVVAEKTPQKEDILTDENGEPVPLKEEKIEPETKENTTVIKPVKEKVIVKEKTAAEKLAEKFKKENGKNGGGIGDNKDAGQNGSPDGDPFKNGNGGHGTGDGGGDGPGKGPGSGPGFGGGKYGIDLKGRAVVKPPVLPKDTKEEGKVVVEITVDSEGNVIEANPNGRGTTTSSALLKAKAKQTALATKFNVDGKFEEQHGTITIVFSFD
ncbi:MAG: energy transducer TonB [Bacteroidetes bacterium]|nr:energy transducer TonB [Bacteroidota bacterium]